jgi:protein phosphatase
MNINLAKLEIAGESNTGLVRHHNEDNFLIYSPPGSPAVLAVVADGIGGHSRGEAASFICCRELLCQAKKIQPAKWDRKFLSDALQSANAKVFDFNYRGKREKPMGTTVVAAIFFDDHLITAHAGDSRIYEFVRSAGQPPLRQLTTDHRPEGFEEAKLFFQRCSIISRSLGTAKFLELDIEERPRPENARYMLCSDGLYNNLPDQLLSGVLGDDSLRPRQMVDRLMRNALLSGEKDNITLICAASCSKTEE